MNRRTLLTQGTAAGAAVALSSFNIVRGAEQPGKKLKVAVVALGRGMGHVSALLTLPDVEIAYLAEVDPKRLERGLKVVADKQQVSCQGVRDFRKILEDKSVDAVFIATPNFWHTPMALMAMQAGKHVYVEKPGSQNPREAEMIVEASKKYNRLVQMGNQRRTWMKDAIDALHGGAIGEAKFGRATYYNKRKAVGVPGELAASPDLDMDMWQGPVPDERDMKPFVHYDWHWLWHWGNGELGNNGIHTLDILRWGLKVNYPERITYLGNRYWFDDKQETPDTGTAVYDCGKVGFEWVQSSCHQRSAEKSIGEIVFYGDKGTMGISRDTWTTYDLAGAETGKGKSTAKGGDPAHIGNFLDAIRGNAKLNSPIDEGQKSTMLCHLGNIAYRTNTVVRCDPKTGKVLDNAGAEKLWGRPEYRKGWDVKV
ncbi:Gfo/Idh/MocA family oxidoreductase [Roseimicrobium sp. ORNL1]|uniref:Gfo/Idh/MocA family protein n=1 Tax=Roseimicrobium sp. ORNL1 TaxID=2711231 RepID=UPI0013E1A4C3|nr:Gfo/Idh/MocA family oxidoreductase [Roseimicrobium sp. ORNL1]QIF00860.1 Gfo/Idh/MocA family oxidoreductase [Roseimicrobium sp. ORNL1]